MHHGSYGTLDVGTVRIMESQAATNTVQIAECPQCGAQVELPEQRISGECAFCQSQLVSGTAEKLSIDRVAPFDVTPTQAAELLKTTLRIQWMAPEAIRKGGRVEAIEGVSLPFWAYDAVARSTYQADVGIHWWETETYTTTNSKGKTVTRTRRVLRVEWFPTEGTHVADYRDQLVSASRGLPEHEANELEPFDLGLCVPFAPELLAGWAAERPSLATDRALETVRGEFSELEGQAIAKFLPGDQHRSLTYGTNLELGEIELFLLPVWIATFSHNGEPQRLLVNGQTGEVVGTVPKSTWKVAGLIGFSLVVALGIAALSGAL